MKSIFLTSLLTCSLFGTAAQAAPTFDPDLAMQLNAAAGQCAFQLYSSGTVDKLQNDPSFLKRLGKEMHADTLHNTERMFSGMAISAGAFLTTELYAKNNPLAFTKGKASLGLAVSAGGLALSINNLGGKDSNWPTDRSQVSQYASNGASCLAKLFQLDALQEDALRSNLVKTILAKAKAGDASGVDLLTLMQKTKYAGKPILSERELTALAQVQKASTSPDGPQPLTSLEAQGDFLTTCRNILSQSESSKSARAVENANDMIAQIQAYQSTHPDSIQVIPASMAKVTPKKRDWTDMRSDTGANFPHPGISNSNDSDGSDATNAK